MFLSVLQERKEKTRIIIFSGLMANLNLLYMVYFYLSTDFSFSVYDISIIAFTIAFVVISIWKFISLCKRKEKWYICNLYRSSVQVFLILAVILYIALYERHYKNDRIERACKRTNILLNSCEHGITILIIFFTFETVFFSLENGFLLYMKLLDNFDPLYYTYERVV